MRFKMRKTFRFGPLYVVVTDRGFSSWGFRLGPVTKNVTRGTTTINTPGLGALYSGGRRRRRS